MVILFIFIYYRCDTSDTKLLDHLPFLTAMYQILHSSATKIHPQGDARNSLGRRGVFRCGGEGRAHESYPDIFTIPDEVSVRTVFFYEDSVGACYGSGAAERERKRYLGEKPYTQLVETECSCLPFISSGT